MVEPAKAPATPSRNGRLKSVSSDPPVPIKRFSDVPSAIEIVLDEAEAVEIDLEGLPDDPTELCTLLENERVARNTWMSIALSYAKYHKVDQAIEVLTKAVAAIAPAATKDKLPMLSCLCWLELRKSREAPRMVPEGTLVSEARTKDFYLRASTAILNDASRINPAFPPLFLARGVLYLLRASLQPPSQTRTPGSPDQSERIMTIRQGIKCFEDALKLSTGRNMLALLGKSRALFSLGQYAEALAGYQEILHKLPGLTNPDPRIGIGCCFWQLGFKEDAKAAWERAVEVNPESPIANVLVGLHHLDSCSHLSLHDPVFAATYRKAMTEYVQKAFKINKDFPLACVNFAGYFYTRKAIPTVERLARKAIEFTDVNAIASDGWFLLARKEHLNDERTRAMDFYRKADEARGGLEKGYLPAKIGLAQLQALTDDMDGAKFRLEKIIQKSKCLEAMILLATIFAQEVFSAQAANSKEDKSKERKKAIALLEAVRLAWKDPEKKLAPDSSVLVTLARLYENESPEKSLQCLQQVEQVDLDKAITQAPPAEGDDEAALRASLREELPPQLLSNIGCFHYAAERFALAREAFQVALNACVQLAQKDELFDIDAHVTTISYNLGRAYEADGMLDEAKKVYQGLLERHSDYTDATTRLAYIALRQNPTDEGPKSVTALVQKDPSNLELRAMYGWYLSKSKKRSTNLAEDPEQRHYKHTLQHFDKHDRYALTGMGNLYLANAREMRRDTESDREKRRKTYEKAVEFFDKGLQLDPQNAYAAQGIAIALVEDKKDYSTAVQIFAKLRETLRDASVLVNLGHVYTELKQYSRAIENYEAALAKDRGRDPQILVCLGRVWLLKAKQEKSIEAMKRSLEYSQQALEIAKDQIHFRFNVAYVQIQLAQLIYVLPETQRTLVEVQAAAQGLDEAIETLSDIAQSDNPPYPKNDIEQRANMGRNTMRKQLERAVQSQREYEERNAAKLQQAREIREAEMKRREEERKKAEELILEEKRRIAEERQRIHEHDRELAERRAEEQRRKEEAEFTTDSETGERIKRKRKASSKRKKKVEDESNSEDNGSGEERKKARRKKAPSASAATTTDDESVGPKKRRRVERKGAVKASRKFKSSELVVDSDSDDTGSGARAHGKRIANGIEDEEAHDSEMQVDRDASVEQSSPDQRLARKGSARASGNGDDISDARSASRGSEDGHLATTPPVNSSDRSDGKDGDGDVAMEDGAPASPITGDDNDAEGE